MNIQKSIHEVITYWIGNLMQYITLLYYRAIKCSALAWCMKWSYSRLSIFHIQCSIFKALLWLSIFHILKALLSTFHIFKAFLSIFKALLGLSIVSNSAINPFIFLLFNSNSPRAQTITRYFKLHSEQYL